MLLADRLAARRGESERKLLYMRKFRTGLIPSRSTWLLLLPAVLLGLIGVSSLGATTKGPLARATTAQKANSGEDKTGQVATLEEIGQVRDPILAGSGRTVARLGLSECVRRALAHNLDIRVSSFGPAIRLNEVVEAEAAFDAVFFGSAQFDTTDRANFESGATDVGDIITDDTVEPILEPTTPFIGLHDYNYAMGLRKKLPTGATIELAQKLRRLRNLRDEYDDLFRNPFYEYSLEVVLRQPLLRDFGLDVNRAFIVAARNNHRVSQQEFELEVIRTAAEVESNYWNLAFARQRVQIFDQQLKQAETTLARLSHRQRLEAGAAVLQRTRGLVEQARANQITARNDVLRLQDQLLESINDPNLPLEGLWEIIPAAGPSSEFYPTNRAESVQLALQLRPEIIIQRVRVDNSGIAVMVAKNQKLPRLDLFAQQDMAGAADGYNSAWNEQWQYETVGYGVGVSFEAPLGNRAARALLARSRHEQKQQQARLQSFSEQVLADVDISLHTLKNRFEEIAVRRRAAEAEADTLRAFWEEEKAGVPITAGFLDRKVTAQERLANSQINAVRTIFDYNVAIMNLNRAQGTLLRYNNIEVSELAPAGKRWPVW